MLCTICNKRKPRRYCPGVSGDICSLCCGNEREVTVACPSDCPYLKEARAREKYPPLGPDAPNADIDVPESFLRDHSEFFLYFGFTLSDAAGTTPAPVDADYREALESLARTYRTLSSGLYYDSRPVNPYAAAIYSKLQNAVAEYREAAQKAMEGSIRDAEVLAVIVIFHRMALHYNNGRPKGRAFVDFLRQQFKPAAPAPEAAASPIITL